MEDVPFCKVNMFESWQWRCMAIEMLAERLDQFTRSGLLAESSYQVTRKNS